MQIQHFKGANFKTAKWAGGATKQLYIFPESADYALRDFDFRISSATVEIPVSDFTLLPGYSRELMILDGVMRVEHRGHYEKVMNRFEHDSFMGDWHTKGFGTCVDFNLMTRFPYTGNLQHLNVIGEYCAKVNVNALFVAFYTVGEQAVVELDGSLFYLEAYELLVVRDLDANNVLIRSDKSVDLIQVEILLNA